MDIHDFKTYNLQLDICNRWRVAHYAENAVGWSRMAEFLANISWMMQSPYSKFIGGPLTRTQSICNVRTLQQIAEARARMIRDGAVHGEPEEQPWMG